MRPWVRQLWGDVMCSFVRVSSENGLWQQILDQWRSQAEGFDDDFESYESGALSIIRPLAEGPQAKNVAIYGLEIDGAYAAIAQLNTALLPKTTGVTLRVRMMLLSPEFDQGSHSIDEYGDLMGHILSNTILVAKNEMKADHVKFHLRSPADRTFFTTMGISLGNQNVFTAVHTTGSWLYITL